MQTKHKPALILEPDVRSRDIHSRALRLLTSENVFVRCIEEAEEAIANKDFGLVIAGGSLETFTRLSQAVQNDSRMIVFCDDTLDIEAQALELGIDAVLRKPLEPVLIQEIYRRTLSFDNFLGLRNMPRFPISMPACVETAAGLQPAVVMNLSRGGLGVATSTHEGLGQDGVKLMLLPNTPGEPEIRIHAELKWVNQSETGILPVGLGLAFKELSMEASKRLFRLINEFRIEAARFPIVDVVA